MDSTFDEFRKVVVSVLEVEISEVVPSARYAEDLGADSLAMVQLQIATEQQFNVVIPDAVGEQQKTVQDTVNYLNAVRKTP